MRKFKPGMETNFILRWVQLTNNTLRYYKNKANATKFFTKSITAVPLNAISEVKEF